MGKIQTDLDRLAELRADLETLGKQIECSIPPRLRNIRDTLSTEVKDLEAEIKTTAANLRTDHRHTFKGKLLQVVYTSRVSYPKAAVEAEVPERYLKGIRKTADVWGIKKTAK